MKGNILLAVLMGTAVIFTGCGDDEFLESTPAQTGDEIMFGAIGKIETLDEEDATRKPGTRTSYGDIEGEGESKSQIINWVNGDKIMIYSPQVTNVSSYVEYKVTSSGNTKGTLAKVNPDEAGLQWGAASTHEFYGVYPAKSALSTGYQELYHFNGTQLTGYIPVTQGHEFSQSASGDWNAECNMNYAHMAARATIEKANGGNGVDLDFYPIVTALDIELTASTDVHLNSVNIIAKDGEPIAGQYVADLETIDVDGKKAPDCDLSNSSTENLNYITVPMYTGEGSNQVPLVLAAGKSIKLTVFMLPHTDLDNIAIRVSGANAGAKECELKNNGISIVLHPHKKTIVRMTLPALGNDPNTWFSGLDNDILFSQLSIPATANSYSYMSNDGQNQAQTVSIKEQWNAGIRCFELRGTNDTNKNNLSNAPLQSGRVDLGITFDAGFNQIVDLLEQNPTEFVMIMASYESNVGRLDTGNERIKYHALDYVLDLQEYCKNVESSFTNGVKFKTYSPTMTVGDARGGIMIIIRATSEEDPEEVIDAVKNGELNYGMLIDEWGSLKDYWGRRGYTINGQKAANWSVRYSSKTDVEYYLLNDKTDSDFRPSSALQAPQKTLGDLTNYENVVDYNHASMRAGNTSGIVFVQEWARVVPESAAGNIQLYSTGYLWNKTYHYAYWEETYSEKQTDVWNTFLLCQQEHSGKVGDRFFINSLDGFYVDKDIQASYWPYIEGADETRPNNRDEFGTGGTAGNVGKYARDINGWFYGELLDMGFENITGPLNLVIMDRVLDGSNGGNYLPQVIIDNNFKFPLLTNGKTPSTNNGLKGGSNTSMGNGGSVWQ